MDFDIKMVGTAFAFLSRKPSNNCLMTIIYNKNAPDYYLVTGLDKEVSYTGANAKKSRNLSGKFMIISSGQNVDEPNGFLKALKMMKKTFLLLLMVSMIPFSSVLAIGYIHLLITNEVAQ